MARPKEPWFKFFPSDWRADPALRSCSLAARGLWVECMCIMHEATPYGHLLVNGRPVSDGALAVLAGCSLDQLPDLFAELDNAGVWSRTGSGVIYSRRMTRDERRRKNAQKNGQKGGNDALKKTSASSGYKKENTASDNPLDNPEDKPPDNPKEARSHIPEPPKPPEPEPWISLGLEVLNLAGLADQPKPVPYSVVRQWLADWTEDDIRTAIKQVAAAPNYTPPAGLKYFETPIRRVAEERRKAEASRVSAISDSTWQIYLRKWAADGTWVRRNGPAPNETGCMVPGRLLQAYEREFGDLNPKQGEAA